MTLGWAILFMLALVLVWAVVFVITSRVADRHYLIGDERIEVDPEHGGSSDLYGPPTETREV